MISKHTRYILIRVPGYIMHADEYTRDLCRRLADLGIHVRSIRPGEIVTKRVRCRIISDTMIEQKPELVRAQRCDECFGFGDELAVILRGDHNLENAYKGTVLQYICEVEGVPEFLIKDFNLPEEIGTRDK